MLMKIRVFQIDHEKDEKNLAFRDYRTALAKNGRIDESIYKQVYGGEVPCRTLEEVYALCNGENKPLGYIAESMSVSNVVEVTQSNNRCCFYVDSVGFKMVDFDTSKADRSDMMRIIILENEKVPYEAEISHNIHAMQNVVDGYIEAIYFTPKDDAIVYCNDEFLLHDYAPNRFVGEILVHGTFFVVGNTRNDYGEWESCSLTDEQVEKYMQQFWGYLVPIQKFAQQDEKEIEECDESEDIGLSQI